MIIAAFIAALHVASCTKQEAESIEIDKIEAASVEPGLKVIKATSPSVVTSTRATISGVKVLWTSGDKISVWSGTTHTYPDSPVSAEYSTNVSPASASAEFVHSNTTEPVKVGGYYLAAYPLEAINYWYSGGARVYFHFFKEQTAVKDGWDSRHGAMFAKSENEAFEFKHYSAYIKFTVGAGSPSFNALKVMTTDGVNITSRIRVNTPDETYAEASQAAFNSDYVRLSTADTNPFEAGTYYISIMPKTYSGLRFIFEQASGYQASKKVIADITLEGGDVLDMGTIGALNFADPSAIDPHIATAYKTQGVYFWVDPEDNSKGKIISKTTTLGKWSTPNRYTTGAQSLTDYEDNYNKTRSIASWETDGERYAQYYCAQLRETYGGNWHLPSQKEVQYLFNAYWGQPADNTLTAGSTDYRGDAGASEAAASFEAALASISGDPLYAADTANGRQFWTGIEYATTPTNAYYYRMGLYQWSTASKTGTDRHIRCIRDVTVE